MTTPNAALAPTKSTQVLTGEERSMEFVPYGSDCGIKLTIKIVQSLVCIKTKSGKICSDNDAIKFMMMCQARRLNPFEGDAFLQGYDSNDGPVFSLITAHQAFLKRAELHPEYDGMDSGVIVREKSTGNVVDREGDFTFEDDILLGAWAIVHFKRRGHPTKRRLKLETFKKGYGRWKDDPAGMIVKCAEADALRSSFPTMLGGLYMQDEIEPITDEQRFRAAKPVTSPTPAALPAPAARVVAHAPAAATVTATAPARVSTPPAADDDDAASAPEASPAPAAAAPAPTAAAPANEGPLEILRRNIVEGNFTEVHVVQWACAKWRLNNCHSLDDVLEVSPRRINELINNWAAYSQEIANSLN